MTVSNLLNKEIYVGDGVTYWWDYTFPIVSASDIKVYIIDSNGDWELITEGYEVDTVNSRVRYPAEGSMLPILPSDWKITIIRERPITQETDLRNQGSLNAEVLELSYDHNIMVSQQLQEQIDRCLKLPVYEVPTEEFTEALYELIKNFNLSGVLVADLSITTEKLANLAVTAQKIANATITADQITNATITGDKIGLATISASNIQNATITGEKIANATITASNIGNATITASQIANATITSSQIATGTITGTNIASGTIASGNIAAGTIVASNIAATTITASEIANLTITTDKIGDLQITNAKINDMDATKISAGLISVSRLNITGIILANFAWTDNSPSAGYVAWSAGSIVYKGITHSVGSGNSNNKFIFWRLASPTVFQSSSSFPSLGDDDFIIATNISGTHDLAWNNSNGAESIDGDTINQRSIQANRIETGTITGNEIATATIAGVNIASATIAGTNIANATIAGSNIASATITASNIANATITATQIANSTITATQIANTTITASQIASLTITASQIADLTITSDKISSIAADKITTGTLDATNVTIQSTDGKMKMTGNLLYLNNGSDVRQITIGKYDGSNYGISIGANASSPDILITSTNMLITSSSFVNFKGSKCLYQKSDGSLSSLIGYVLSNFVIQGDSTNGVNIYGNGGNICLGETSGSYGGGSKVVFIPDRSAAPSTNPSGGGIMYAESGALKWRGSSGTVTTIAAA